MYIALNSQVSLRDEVVSLVEFGFYAASQQTEQKWLIQRTQYYNKNLQKH